MRRLLVTHARAVLTVLVAALLVVGFAQAAAAHGDLEGGSPGPGDAVAAGSEVVRLDLAGADPDATLAIGLTDAEGQPVAVGDVAVVGDSLCAATAPLEAGVWTLDYAGVGLDDDRFSGRYEFEVLATGGPAVSPGVCAEADLAEPGDAETVAEATDAPGEAAGVPGWVIALLVALGVLAVAGVVVRVRRDRAAEG